MIIDNEYEIGDTVYLVTDKEQDQRLVFAITVYKSGELLYKIVCGTSSSDHYAFELSDTKNILSDV